MKYLLAFTLFAYNLSANAQAIGSSWYYSSYRENGFVTYAGIFISGTETVAGKDVFTLSFTENAPCAAVKTNYLLKEGNKIKYYDAINQAFYLLYDFDLVAGESYDLFANDGDITSKIVIDSTGTFDFNGRSLKAQYVHSENPRVELSGMILEEIGSIDYLFPYLGLCDPHNVVNLRCYTNLTDGTEHFSEWDCQEEGYVSVNEIERQNYSLSPNPGQDHILVTLPENSLLQIFNSAGEKIMEVSLTANAPQKIDISSFASGIYLAKTFLNTYNLKFLKQ